MSDVAIRNICRTAMTNIFQKENGLPRQCDHWLAMTCVIRTALVAIYKGQGVKAF